MEHWYGGWHRCDGGQGVGRNKGFIEIQGTGERRYCRKQMRFRVKITMLKRSDITNEKKNQHK